MSLINQMLQDLDRRHVSMVGSIPLETVRSGESTQPFTQVKKANPKLAIGLMTLALCAVAGGYAATQMHLPLLKIMQQHPNSIQAEVISSASANVPEKTKPKTSTALQTPTTAAQPSNQDGAQSVNIHQQLALLTHAETTNAALLQAKSEEINQLKAQLQQMAEEATNRQLPAPQPLVQKAPASSVKHIASQPARLDAKLLTDNTLPLQPTGTDKANTEVKTENIKVAAGKSQFNKQVSPEQESDAAYNQALSMLQLGRAPEAQELLAKAMTLNPNNHDVRQTLVGVLVDLKRNNEAIEYLKTGVQLEQQEIGFSQMLARLLIENNQRAEAMAVLVKALPYAHEDAQYHAFLAALLQSEEKHKEAIDHYLIALKHGNQANWLVGLGISLQAEGRMQDAHDIYARAQNTQLNADLAQFVDQRIKQVQQQLN
jgi:MSHA biogenesis protein MshN